MIHELDILHDFLCDFWKLSIQERRYFRRLGMKYGVDQCTARMERVETLVNLIEKIKTALEAKKDCCRELYELTTNRAYLKEPMVIPSCTCAKKLLDGILKNRKLDKRKSSTEMNGIVFHF